MNQKIEQAIQAAIQAEEAKQRAADEKVMAQADFDNGVGNYDWWKKRDDAAQHEINKAEAVHAAVRKAIEECVANGDHYQC